MIETTVDLSQAIIGLFEKNPERWVQGNDWVGEDCCILGAATKIMITDGVSRDAWTSWLGQILGMLEVKSIVEFNDKPGQTVEGVIQLLKAHVEKFNRKDENT